MWHVAMTSIQRHGSLSQSKQGIPGLAVETAILNPRTGNYSNLIDQRTAGDIQINEMLKHCDSFWVRRAFVTCPRFVRLIRRFVISDACSVKPGSEIKDASFIPCFSGFDDVSLEAGCSAMLNLAAFNVALPARRPKALPFHQRSCSLPALSSRRSSIADSDFITITKIGLLFRPSDEMTYDFIIHFQQGCFRRDMVIVLVQLVSSVRFSAPSAERSSVRSSLSGFQSKRCPALHQLGH